MARNGLVGRYGGGSSSGGSLSDFFAPSRSGDSGPTVGIHDESAIKEDLPASEQLGRVARLYYSGSDRNKRIAESFLKENQHRFADEDLKAFNLPKPKGKDKRSLFQKAAGFTPVRVGLGLIGRPGQAAMHLEKTVGETLGTTGYGLIHGKGVGRSFDVAGQTARNDFKETGKATVDLSGKHDINTREMLGLEKNAGAKGKKGYKNWLFGSLDLAGQTALDPVSFVSPPGAKEATDTALRVVGKKYGETVAADVVKRGARKALTEEQIAEVRKALVQSAKEAGAGQRRGLGKAILGAGEKTGGGPISKLKDAAIAEAAGQKGAMKGLTGAERVAQRNLDFLLSRGQAGLKFGGETVLARDTMRAPFEKLGIASTVAEDGTRIGSKIPGVEGARSTLRQAFVSGADVERDHGAAALAAMKGEREVAEGTRASGTADALRTVQNAQAHALKEGLTQDEMRHVIYPAMEKTVDITDEAGTAAHGAATATHEAAVQRVVGFQQDVLAASRELDRPGISSARRLALQDQIARGTERIKQAEAAVADSAAVVEDAAGKTSRTISGAEDLAQRYRAAGKVKTAEYVETLDHMRSADTARLEAAGLLPEEVQHATDQYMRRVITKEGEKWAKAMAEGKAAPVPGFKPNELLGEQAVGGSVKARGLHPEKTVEDVNRIVSDEIAPEALKGKDLFRQDPGLSVGMHAADTERAIASKQYMDAIGKLTDDKGLPMLTTDAEEAAKHGFEQIPGTDAYAPQAVRNDIARFQAVVVNDPSIKGFYRSMDKAQRVWKAYATVPLIGAAFHARNAETNVLLNYMAGMENPVWYSRAYKAQRYISKAEDELAKGVDMTEALKKVGAPEQTIKEILLAREHNVLGSSYFNTDLRGKDALTLTGEGVGKRVAHGLNPMNLDNYAIRSGRAVGGGIEDNARLAHFMWAMDRYGDVGEAAMSVKKYLFNYEDLTNFEKKVLKPVIPFYTFMRKNSALVIRNAIEAPDRAAKFARAQKAVQDSGASNPDLAGISLPDYTVEGGQTPVGLAGLGGVTTRIESPWSAASDALAPFASAGALTADGLIPGSGRGDPLKALENREGWTGTAGDLVNLPGGPAAETVKNLVEVATGKDLFTGGDSKWRTGDKLDKLLKLSEIIAPAPTKVNSTFDKLRLNDWIKGNPEQAGALLSGQESPKTDLDRKRKAAMLNLLFGLTTTAYDEKTSASVNYARFAALQDKIDRYNQGHKGHEVPTLGELRDGGIIPEAGS